jgi:hypothetical protein
MLNHDSLYEPSNTSYWTIQDSITLTALPTMDTNKIRIPDGVWYFHLTAQDTVGHLSANADHYRIKIDKTPPQSHLNVGDTVLGCATPISILSEDNLSGVFQSEFKVDSGSWTAGSQFTIPQPGYHSIEFYSGDSAGNFENLDTAVLFVNANGLALNLGSDTSVCDSFHLQAPIGYGYIWSTGEISSSIQITQSGTYSLEMIDSTNCMVTDSIYITVALTPLLSFNYDIINDTVYFNNFSENADSFLWVFGDGDSSFIENPNHFYDEDGFFTIKLFAFNDTCGFSDTSATIAIIGVSNQVQNAEIYQIGVYPNPNNGNFILSFTNPLVEIVNVDLINILGQIVVNVVYGQTVKNYTHEVDAQTLTPAVYYLKVTIGNSTVMKKLVIQN